VLWTCVFWRGEARYLGLEQISLKVFATHRQKSWQVGFLFFGLIVFAVSRESGANRYSSPGSDPKARSPSGKAKVCKTFIGGSIPPRASKVLRPVTDPGAAMNADRLVLNYSELRRGLRQFPKFVAGAALCLLAMLALTAPCFAQTSLSGLWDATIKLDHAEVPFRFEIAQSNSQIQGFFFEGEKRVGSTSGQFVNGELRLDYEFLYTTLTAKLNGDQLDGTYRANRKNGKEYVFHARRFQPPALDSDVEPVPPQVAGNWEMKLVGEDHSTKKDPRSALSWKLFLRQSGPEVTGAILRIDGDTGTLTGGWRGSTLVLSHFAGERPILFEAQLQTDGTLSVTYNRLNNYIAARTSEARAKGIPDPPDSTGYTTVADPSEPFHFRFPGLDGKIVSDSDPRFEGKVVLLAIGGTWCPNCRDEAPSLVDLYRRYHAQGLEILGLNFEAAGDPLEDNPRIVSFVQEFSVPYPVLLAGKTGEVQDKLPQLVNFGAYPTTVLLGRDGRVRTVHAGFASAATGEANSELAQEVRESVQRLLAEAPPAGRSDTLASQK
jgi:thiol-disulfide isomerase/thioredoxin